MDFGPSLIVPKTSIIIEYVKKFFVRYFEINMSSTIINKNKFSTNRTISKHPSMVLYFRNVG